MAAVWEWEGEVRIDVHVHTTVSLDSSLTPGVLSRLSRKTGILPAITDHDTVEGWAKCDFPFIPGEEVSTAQGHLLALFLTEAVPPRLSVEETLELIHEQGGIGIAAHPFDFARHGMGDKAFLCDGLEDNAKAPPLPEVPSLPVFAGSDAHDPFSFGQAWNLMPGFAGPKGFLRSAAISIRVVRRNWLLHTRRKFLDFLLGVKARRWLDDLFGRVVASGP